MKEQGDPLPIQTEKEISVDTAFLTLGYISLTLCEAEFAQIPTTNYVKDSNVILLCILSPYLKIAT